AERCVAKVARDVREAAACEAHLAVLENQVNVRLAWHCIYHIAGTQREEDVVVIVLVKRSLLMWSEFDVVRTHIGVIDFQMMMWLARQLGRSRLRRLRAQAEGHAERHDCKRKCTRRPRPHESRSKMPAAPIPPPMHMVTMPYRAFLRCKSRMIVAVGLAPVQRSGWPSAIAPPLGFTRAASRLPC